MNEDTQVLDHFVNQILKCPVSGVPLNLQTLEDGSTVWASEDGKVSYPIERGIARFVKDDGYVQNFSHEWTVHKRTQLDHEESKVSEEEFSIKTGWTADDVKGKRVLDVGCGMGRFADIVLKWGGEVIGIDLSFAVESAQQNLGDNSNFRCLQASVFDLPFKEESFDLIYSLGVLHHTPDCERAFKALPALLKPEGKIAIWVYSSHVFTDDGIEETRDRILRKFTTAMDPQKLHKICQFLCRIRLRPRALWHMLLPGIVFHAIPRLHDSYEEYQWRVLDTFDWYSPKYQSKHSYPEICRWFRECGLKEIIPLDFPTSVQGVK